VCAHKQWFHIEILGLQLDFGSDQVEKPTKKAVHIPLTRCRSSVHTNTHHPGVPTLPLPSSIGQITRKLSIKRNLSEVHKSVIYSHIHLYCLV